MTQEMKSLLAKLDNWRLPPDPWSGVSEPNPLAQQAAAALRTQAAEIDALAKRLGEQGLEIIEYAKSLAMNESDLDKDAQIAHYGQQIQALTAERDAAVAALAQREEECARLTSELDHVVSANRRWANQVADLTAERERLRELVGPVLMLNWPDMLARYSEATRRKWLDRVWAVREFLALSPIPADGWGLTR